MTEPGLRKAIAASAILHLGLFILMGISMTAKQRPLLVPKTYTVNLVSFREAAPAPAAPKAEAPKPAPVPAKPAPPAPKPAPIPAKPAPSMTVPAPPAKPAPVKPMPEEATISDTEHVEDVVARIKGLDTARRISEERGKFSLSSGDEPALRPAEEAGMREAETSRYWQIVRDSIDAEFVFPSIESRIYIAVVNIAVKPDGYIVIEGFEKKSGNLTFDLSARRAIEKASPIVPPPPYEMKYEVSFDSRNSR